MNWITAPGHYDGDGCTFPTPGHMVDTDSAPDDTELNTLLAESEDLPDALGTIAEKYEAQVTNNEPRWVDGHYLRHVGDFIRDVKAAFERHAAQAVSRPDRETIAALLGISDEYFDAIQGGEPENWVRLIDHLWKVSEALKAVSPPDRETLARIIKDADDNAPLTHKQWLLKPEQMADAILAALSTQPAAGEVEWEYNIAYPETTAEGVVWWNPDGAEPSDSIEIVRDDLASGSYLDSDRIVRRRKAGPWVEVQPEPQPTEEAK